MSILAIDPGTHESGWVKCVRRNVIGSGVAPNTEVLRMVRDEWYDDFAVEMIASYGMPVGAEVFETCVWIGRFVEAYEVNWERYDGTGMTPGHQARLVYRNQVKMHLCGTPRAKDPNIRQALIDLLGPPGTKANPGPTYGVKSHAWAALGVAVTALAREK